MGRRDQEMVLKVYMRYAENITEAGEGSRTPNLLITNHNLRATPSIFSRLLRSSKHSSYIQIHAQGCPSGCPLNRNYASVDAVDKN
jgi:hypothetical protein